MKCPKLLLLALLSSLPFVVSAQIVLNVTEDKGLHVEADSIVVDGVTYKFHLGTCTVENDVTGVPSVINVYGGSFEAVSYDDSKATSVTLRSYFTTDPSQTQNHFSIVLSQQSKYSCFIHFPNGEVNARVTSYPKDLFSEKPQLVSLTLPEAEIVLGDGSSLSYAFYKDSNLTTINGLKNLKTDNVTSMHCMFNGCSGLTSLDVTGFKTDNVTYMGGMFSGCSSLTSLDVSGFKTDNVTDMGAMFTLCSSLTSLDVSGFKTDNVTDMSWMFLGCSSLTSLDVSDFKTDNVTNMSAMFDQCFSLTSLDVSGFKTDNVTNMYCMFYHCSSLTSLDVSGFKTDNVTDMGAMFSFCSSLTSLDVSGFKTDNVTNMRNMFTFCDSLTSLDLSGFKTDNVTDMGYMFSFCSSLASLDVSGFKTDNVTDMCYMFYGCSSLTSLDVSGFKNDNVTDMGNMFDGCSSLTSLDVSGFETDNVKDMSWMFHGCSSLTSLDVSGFKTDNVTNMSRMFYGCSSLTSLDVSGFKTDNVTDMSVMFCECSSLTSLDVSGFKTDNVTDMCYMFDECFSLTSLDVSGFKTDNVTDLAQMFYGCSSLMSLDMSGFRTDNVKDMFWMFYGCSSLTTIYANPEKWSTANVTSSDGMFYGCSALVGGNGTTYNGSHTDAKYACVDIPGQPGYFTDINDKKVDVVLEPMADGDAVDVSVLADKSLLDSVVDGVYYNVGSDGYDASEGCIVIGQATDMSQIGDGEPGSEAVKDGFTGIILKVAAGRGTVRINARTSGDAQLVVQVGNQTPVPSSVSERDEVIVYYRVTEDTYVYIYAAHSGSSSARRQSRLLAPSTEDAVRIYGIRVSSDVPTGIIATSHDAESTVIHSLSGQRLTRPQRGVNIVGGRKVVVR